MSADAENGVTDLVVCQTSSSSPAFVPGAQRFRFDGIAGFGAEAPGPQTDDVRARSPRHGQGPAPKPQSSAARK